MIKDFKIFESNNKIDKNPYFMLINESEGKYKCFVFLYNMHKNKNKKLYEFVQFIYKEDDIFDKLNIEFSYENSYFEVNDLKTTKLITPKEFFTKYENICFLLYDTLDEWLKKYNRLNSRYTKLLDTLKNIEELKYYVNSKKYNI